MTNKELQEYLKQFPDDAIMECLEFPDDDIMEFLEEHTSGYYSYTSYVEMAIDDLVNIDFRLSDNLSDGLKDKVFIRIGRK